MASVIAIVRLAHGRVGYFDEITRIHLTIAAPEKPVIEGMNVSNLKRAVRGGSIKVVSGSLEPEATLKQEPVIESQIPVAPIITEQAAEVITAQTNRVVEVPEVSEPIQVEEPAKVEEPAEIVEPVQEEAPIVEEVPVVEEAVDPVEETESATEEAANTPKPKTKKKK